MNPPSKSTTSRKNGPANHSAITLDYNELLRICLKYWWIIAACLAIGVVASTYYAKSQISIYSSQATILVPDKAPKIPSLNDGVTTDAKSGDLLKTYEQLLQTRDLSLRVVKALHLESDPEFLGGPTPVSEETATDMLTNRRTIRIHPSTRLIDITVEHHSPKVAEMLADEFARQAIQQDVDRSTQGAVDFSQQLDTQIRDVADELKKLDQAVEDYREAHPDDSLSPTADTVDQNVLALNNQYNADQNTLIQLQQHYLDDNPKVMDAKAKVAADLEQLRQKRDAAQRMSRNSIEYHDLQARADAKRLQYTKLLDVLATSKAAENFDLPSISIAEKAQFPYAPIRPNKQKIVMGGGLGGLMVGLGIIAVIYFMDQSAKSVIQVESFLSLPVLAAVPVLDTSDLRKSRIPTHYDPDSVAAESFRSLRATLFLHDNTQLHRTILMASAIPGEGKTFCSANLAIALAQAGLRTLVIDADLRRSTLLGYFDPAAHEKRPPGLTDIILGKATLSSVMIDSTIENLWILASGSRTRSSAELLSAGTFTALLQEASKSFDRVIIDSAPLNAVSDSLLIIQKVDAALLVVRSGMTPLSESKAALAKFTKSEVALPLGVILNYTQRHAMKVYDYGYN